MAHDKDKKDGNSDITEVQSIETALEVEEC